MAIQEQYLPANRFCLSLFNAAVDVLGVADANILSLTTWAGTNTTTSMEGMIRNLTVAERHVHLQRQIADQLAKVPDLGLSTNTALAAADTVSGVRSIFTTNDSSLNSSLHPTFAFAV